MLLCSADAAQDYKVVSACPRDETSWNAEAARKNCQEPTPDYLCAAMENWVGHFGEICTKYGLSPASKWASYRLDMNYGPREITYPKSVHKLQHGACKIQVQTGVAYSSFCTTPWLIFEYFKIKFGLATATVD
jgi:hypothetical protein